MKTKYRSKDERRAIPSHRSILLSTRKDSVCRPFPVFLHNTKPLVPPVHARCHLQHDGKATDSYSSTGHDGANDARGPWCCGTRLRLRHASLRGAIAAACASRTAKVAAGGHDRGVRGGGRAAEAGQARVDGCCGGALGFSGAGGDVGHVGDDAHDAAGVGAGRWFGLATVVLLGGMRPWARCAGDYLPQAIVAVAVWCVESSDGSGRDGEEGE
jgi:hypothetical protein